MKYTEKADIAAKAVKVLDSVTMSRQKVAAKNYAQIARKNILKCKDEHVSRFWGGFIIKASPAIEQIDSALESMQKRLNKPRYTLKDGEWVRKDSDKYHRIAENKRLGAPDNDGFRSAQPSMNAQMASLATQMDTNLNRMGGPYSLVGSGHYDHRGQ